MVAVESSETKVKCRFVLKLSLVENRPYLAFWAEWSDAKSLIEKVIYVVTRFPRAVKAFISSHEKFSIPLIRYAFRGG